MSLESALPARIEQDGRLVLQIRPGRWQVTLKARSEGPTNELTLPVPPQAPAPPTPKSVGPEEAFDASEVWAFSARPELRLVDVAGGVAVDPQQTLLPTQWRSYPAYLMQPGQRFASSSGAGEMPTRRPTSSPSRARFGSILMAPVTPCTMWSAER